MDTVITTDKPNCTHVIVEVLLSVGQLPCYKLQLPQFLLRPTQVRIESISFGSEVMLGIFGLVAAAEKHPVIGDEFVELHVVVGFTELLCGKAVLSP